jgi:DNA-directed RNA polymerase subunit RPC12/RpoP
MTEQKFFSIGDDEEETIELIASGYEWTCPHCNHLNNEIEIPENVVCSKCKREYEVDNTDHAWG